MNIEIEGFAPYDKQKDWIQAIEDPEVKYAMLLVGRQVGKTLLAENLLLKWALEHPKSTLMWVSPIYSQARKPFNDIINVLAGTPIIHTSNKSEYEIVLLNGSKLLFRSGEKADGLRGYTLDYLIIDEAAFIKDEVWNTILKPTILVKGRKVLFTSTPKGKNYLYSLATRGLDPDQKQYLTINGSSYDNPFIDKSELEEARKSLPENIFRQEILGEFVDSGGEVFSDVDNYCVLNNWQGKQNNLKYYAGIDVGRQDDYSVLTILNDAGEVVFIYRDRHKPWDTILSEIKKYLVQYNATAFMEVNSIGDVLFEQLQKQYKNIHPFITTQSSKQDIIEDLIYELNKGELKLPSDTLFAPLYNELRTFTYSYSPSTRKVSYRAISGAHDDTIISLALALHSLRKKKTKGQYHIYA
jgi:phage FluMu gp28-like protein